MSKLHIKNLDGFRALAIISVVIYHFYPNKLPGGFLGVDLFFVISGFLISALLIHEFKETKNIDLKGFYIRRIKRIFPALFFMIIVVMSYLALFEPVLFYDQIDEALVGSLFIMNWYNIFVGVDYFATFNSIFPFKHLWSIAIEEQFYLLFPAFLLVLNKFLHLKKEFIIIVMFTLALLLSIVMANAYTGDNVSFIYYNLFSRLPAFLIGCIFAYLYFNPYIKNLLKTHVKLFDLLGLMLIALFIILICFVSEEMPWMYQFGIYIIYWIFGLMIFILCSDYSKVGSWLNNPLFIWIGKRSYSIYLWHYPVIVIFIAPAVLGTQSIFTCLILTLIFVSIANFSYAYIENPLRFNKWRVKTLPLKTLLTLAFVLIGFVGSIVYVNVKNPNQDLTYSQPELVRIDTLINNTAAIIEQTSVVFEEKLKEIKDAVPPVSTVLYSDVILLGDSISVELTDDFKNTFGNDTIVDAYVGKQFSEIVEEAEYYSYLDSPDTVVVIQTGTNGYVTNEKLEQIINYYPQSTVIFINNNIPNEWCQSNNEGFKYVTDKYPNAYLVDWYAASIDHPEYLSTDHVHLTSSGQAAMMNEINKVLNTN